jgi:hypothetical protein
MILVSSIQLFKFSLWLAFHALSYLAHPQHIIIRGNNREPVFNTDEDDYRYF